MGELDCVDQQLQSMQTLRKTYKWYSKIALRLFSQDILNTCKVFVNYHQ